MRLPDSFGVTQPFNKIEPRLLLTGLQRRMIFGKCGVPYGSRTRVAAVKEKRTTVIQGHSAAVKEILSQKILCWMALHKKSFRAVRGGHVTRATGFRASAVACDFVCFRGSSRSGSQSGRSTKPHETTLSQAFCAKPSWICFKSRKDTTGLSRGVSRSQLDQRLATV